MTTDDTLVAKLFAVEPNQYTILIVQQRQSCKVLLHSVEA